MMKKPQKFFETSPFKRWKGDPIFFRMGPTGLSRQEVMEMLSLVSCDIPDGRFLVFCVKPGEGQLPCYKDARAVCKGAPNGKELRVPSCCQTPCH